MEKSSKQFFSYPPNLHELDLATLVSMYRDRGIPKKAKPGEYFACSVTSKLIKEGKWWFGQYFSQQAWDETLTKGCEGYPLTEVEMNILGLVYAADDEAPKRDYVEQNCGAIGKQMYGKKFKPEMLKINQGEITNPKIERAPKEDSEQANLF